MKIIGEIPARIGSKRIKQKNLRLLNGKPMIYYAIQAAKHSKLLDEVFVNTENEVLGKVAIENGVNYYKRSEYLSTDDTKQEEFNYDFIKGTGADVLVMINPVSPLIDSKDIDGAIQFYLEHDYDTVITIEEIRQQAFCDNKPININTREILQPTQNISPIQLCAWSITIWRAKKFIEVFENNNYGTFSGKLGFYPLSRQKCLKISYEEDFNLAELILQSREAKKISAQYYRTKT